MRTVRPLFFVLWVLGGTAWAEQAAEEVQQCKARVQDARVAPDLAVQDCGRALQANQLSQVDRVDVLFNRAVAYERAGEHGRAIQDYSEVIRLKPTLAAAFVSRGLAYAATKEYGRAIADYN
jgi:lipoprotein NlpI